MHPLVNCSGWGVGSCCKLRGSCCRSPTKPPEAGTGLQCSWVLTAGRFACSCQDRWRLTLPGLGPDRPHLLYSEIWWLAQGFCWFIAKHDFPTDCIPATHLATNSSSSVYVEWLKLWDHPIAEQFWLALGAGVQQELEATVQKWSQQQKGQSHFIHGHSTPVPCLLNRWGPWKCGWTNVLISSSMAVKPIQIPDPTKGCLSDWKLPSSEYIRIHKGSCSKCRIPEILIQEFLEPENQCFNTPGQTFFSQYFFN